MPQETVVQRYGFSIFAIVIGSLIAVIAVCGTLGLVSLNESNQNTAQLQILNQRLQLLQGQTSVAQNNVEKSQLLTKMRMGLGLQFDVKQFVSQLLELRTRGMVLSILNLASGSVSLSGFAPSLASLADYMQKVNSVSGVASVSVQGVTSQGSISGYTFNATINLVGTRGGQ